MVLVPDGVVAVDSYFGPGGRSVNAVCALRCRASGGSDRPLSG